MNSPRTKKKIYNYPNSFSQDLYSCIIILLKLHYQHLKKNLHLLNSKNRLVFDIMEEEETMGYSQMSDQPLRQDYDLRQVQNAFNNSDPTENIKNYIHNPRQIYKLKLRLHINTMIYLPKGEEVLAYSLGDSEAFQVTTFQDTIPNLINIKSL